MILGRSYYDDRVAHVLFASRRLTNPHRSQKFTCWVLNMLLNAWLTAAKRQIFHGTDSSASSRRRQSSNKASRHVQLESLESRTLLTALTINDSNIDSFVDVNTGNLSVTEAQLGTHDTIVIEQVTLDSTGEAISIDLTGVTLERLAIETVTVNTFTGPAIDINLTNVTGLRTISIEDVVANGDFQAIDINLVNTDVFALTIEDSSLSGIVVDANTNSDIGHGIITENQISAPANSAAIELNVNAATADDFRIVNNFDVSALNRDAIRVNLTDAPSDGLVIENNVIGNEPGADVSFRAEGDTFLQPFQLTNRASDGELLQQFVLDLSPLGLVFDIDAVLGKPFTPQVNAAGVDTGTLTGVQAAQLSSNNQILTLNFTDFMPGETLLFVIDVDNAPLTPGAPPQDFSAFGRDLIGANVSFQFGPGASSGPKQVAGTMVGDANVFNASEFARGADSASDFHGINLNLDNSPLTNAKISGNQITGVAGHGVLFGSTSQSDVSAVVSNNTVLSSGKDGVHLDLVDSNFTGAIIDNTIGSNQGHGVAIVPRVTRTRLVEAALDGAPIVITSTNHELQTGDQIIVQGMVNDDPTINYPGNGIHTVTRIDNNRFSLDGTTGLPASVVYAGGGAWYVPDFQLDGSARGLVEVDLKATEPQGRIQTFLNTAGDVQVTSLAHGLVTGDRVRINGAAGTGISGTQSYKVTVIDDDNFSLDGLSVVGPYDTSGGLATWTKNIVENAADAASGEVVITSQNHGLLTGDEIRVVGMTVSGISGTTPSSANGRFTVTKLTNDTFILQGSQNNGTYTVGSGYWVPFNETTFSGDELPQIVSGNSIDGNGKAGFYVELSTGTRFDGDIVDNTVSANDQKGIHILSRSFGLGAELPLDPNDPVAVPDFRDISFDVNIGTSTSDGNDISSNFQAGVVIEALDFATGSFEINGNRINSNLQETDGSDPFDRYEGDGIVVRLASDLLTSESVAFLSESIIEDNQIGVDSRGNRGNGLNFSLGDRTKIQDLEINNNKFLNSGLDGFHFVRTEDGDLNSVIFEGNDATNNAGDGFDIFAQNTVKDRLDFRIRNSNIDNNGEYGIRVDVQADARVEIDIAGSRIRENGSSDGGFNPNDGAGATGKAGGVGIHGFQQVEVIFKAEDVQILNNIGDGFSVDAENFFDTLTINASFIDSDLNGNTLTGLRSVGAAFGTYTWTRSDFVGNGSDGARIISNVDINDRSNRRVGGQDIDVYALGNDFQLNGGSGVVLGQGVSATFGNGDVTENFANEFGGRLDADRTDYGTVNSLAGNAEDGLKIVQDAGPYLRENNIRRMIQSQGNFFTYNAGDGVDIGHFVQNEGGNVLHGEEVISDTHVALTLAEISNNIGDGVEWLADEVLRVRPADGSGQDVDSNPNISSLSITTSTINNNGERGVDILNRVNEDSRVTLYDNKIIGNGFSGVYVVNTSSHYQLQNGPEDPLAVEYHPDNSVRTDVLNFNNIPLREPNIELRVQDNLIESNGTAARSSTVPVNFSDDSAAQNGAAADPSYHHQTDLITGTLGGLVIRVGTTGTSHNFTTGGVGGTFFGSEISRIPAADPDLELGQAGVDAEVWENSFDGNFGADVYFDNFVSLVPPQSADNFHEPLNPPYRWNRGFRDPLSRLDLVFRENDGNSLDVINGFAFLDNNENVFKSRQRTINGFPVDGGIFTPGARGGTVRRRNSTRTLGYFNDVGDVPSSQPISPAPGGFWSYDGWGTPTWRVESDFDFDEFTNTSSVAGLSTFFDIVNISEDLFAEEDYQWDTGVNVPGFTGATPYSLQRGDIFGVLDTDLTPILPDQLEENDNFVGATRLLLNPLTEIQTPLSGVFSVNSLTTDGNLNIERKGDRDYFQFIAAGTGALQVDLGATDASGDDLSFLVYEVRPDLPTSEFALVRAADGSPVYTTVNAGGTGSLIVNVVAGRSYYIEVLSDETPNLGRAAAGKNYVYGTTRSYSLSIDAPLGPAPVLAADPISVLPTLEVASSPGVLAPASIAGQNPSLDSITNISPDPVSTSVNTITIHFDEDVTGVDRTDFQLTRNTLVLDTSGILVNQIDPQTYAITNLADLTNQAGSYTFSLVVAGSNIVDTDFAPLQVSGLETESWVLDNTISFTGDTPDNIPGDMDIADVNGQRSLRAAINEANANPGNDIIELAAGTYTLSLAERFEDEGLSGDLDIRESLTIRGRGDKASDTVIDAAQVDRIFHVFPGVELILENLTLTGGEAFDGAGLFVEGSRTTSGIAAGSAGSVQMTDVNVVGNEAYNQGGGIYNLGTVDALRSSISNNIAGSRGGGVFNHGQLDLLNATVSSNFAVSRGGGIYNEVLASAVNTAIRPAISIAELSAINATIAFNHAESDGGGIFSEATSLPQIGNTIIDQNTAASRPNLVGPVTSLGFNFIGDLGPGVVKADLALSAAEDIVADPLEGIISAGLDPTLTNTGAANINGTYVHALLAGGHAIDRGSISVYATAAGTEATTTALVTERDQRNSPRLVRVNEDPNSSALIDIGATEYFVSLPIALFTANPNPAGSGETVNFDGSSSTHSLVPGNSKIVLYEWDFIYDGTFVRDVFGATLDTTSRSYPAQGTYQAALRVTDDDGVTDIFVETIVISAPTAPVVLTPFGGGTSDSTPFISWSGGSGQFRLEVTQLSTGALVIDEPDLSTTSFTPTTRLEPGFYRVVVTAVNADGEESSVPYDFEVIRIAVNYPAQGSLVFDTTPEFTFTSIPDAETYQVWVSEIDPATGQGLGIPINQLNINADIAQIPGTELATYEPPNPLPEGFYRVWARAFDEAGNAGDWSAGNAFTITKPIITGPAFQTGSTIDSNPTITWTDIDANQYQVWLTQISGTTADGTVLTGPQLILNQVVPGTSFTPTTLGNGQFRVWVRAIGDDGEAGLWSEQYNFTRDLTSGPQLISPIGGVNQTDRTPILEWEAQDGATHYEVWVNSSTGITRVIYNDNVPHIQGAATITYTDTSVLLFNATYRWWVRAFNEDGAMTDWSTSDTFFVPVPTITAPTGTVASTNLPTFTWTGVPEYVTYELWVNNVTTGQSRVILERGITGTSFTPALPLENGTFRFWVRGIDADGNVSQWSNPVNFDVNSTVGNAPILVSPQVSIVGRTPTFVWTPVASNVANYEILVKNLLVTGQPVVLNQVITNPGTDLQGNFTFTPQSLLSPSTYRWWIRGLNADANPGPWAQPLDFQVTSVDNPIPLEDDPAEQPVLLASLPSEAAWTDELRSITVHPAAVVATMTTLPDVGPAEAAAVTEGSSESDVDMDSVMEELATADWWRSDAVLGEAHESGNLQPEALEKDGLVIDQSSVNRSETSERSAEASVLGIALASAAGRIRRRRTVKRDDE